MDMVFGITSQKCFCFDEQVVADVKSDCASAGGIADVWGWEQKTSIALTDCCLCFIRSEVPPLSGGFCTASVLLPGPILFHTQMKYSWNLRCHFTSLTTSSALFPLLCSPPWIIPLPQSTFSALSRTQGRTLSPLPCISSKTVRQTIRAGKWQAHCLSPKLGLPLLYKLSHIFPVVNLKPVRWCTIGYLADV